MSYDLTRWNRAGLKTFRYVDGNAATYLEALRLDLAARFPGWSDLAADVPAGETPARRNVRLERQYTKVTREWGWEITRGFARAVHVLTEYLDAYANEGYLGTATQWENVRRLVAMIGYHPAPPASAATPLVLLAKAGQSGLVAKGFQIAYTPKTGAPVLFETLEDLQVAAELNALRAAGWNASPAGLSGAVWQLGDKQTVSAGALAIIHNTATDVAYSVRITAVDSQRRIAFGATGAGNDGSGWPRGAAVLRFHPAAVFVPRLNGSGVIQLPVGHGLAAGDVVAWQMSGGWYYNTVQAVDARAARLDGTLPAPADDLYRVVTIRSRGGALLFPSGNLAASTKKTGVADDLTGYTITTESASEADFSASYKKIAAAPPAEIYLVPQQSMAHVSVAPAPAAGEYVFSGSPNGLSGGELLVAELADHTYEVARVETVVQREDAFTLTFAADPAGAVVRIYGPFTETLRPLGFDVNETALANPLRVGLAPGQTLPGALTAGKRVILENVDADGATLAAHSARIASVDISTGEICLDSLPEAAKGFTLGGTVLRGNVALAGHGETTPAKVLGNGDATRSFQQFLLKEKEISFVADASQPNGVAAAIAVSVAGQIWGQKATLDDSEPADPHYTVRLTEDGELRIDFGDGVRGRRLPTGTNNVRVSYRTGTGLNGNVPAGCLVKPVKPHALVEAVRQPLDATGGNDREPIESLRAHAPAALFTLGRAVSLDDYARLAERNAGVWQARAFRRPGQGARQDRIEVVVVPAGGGMLGELADRLRDYLESNDLPGAGVTIVNHAAVPFDLTVSVQVDSRQYVPAEVAARVRQALSAAFALNRRRLGQPLYISEIYTVVEAVAGVANSDCVIGDGRLAAASPPPRVLRASGGAVRVVQPAPDQVLILDDHASTLAVQTREFVR